MGGLGVDSQTKQRTMKSILRLKTELALVTNTLAKLVDEVQMLEASIEADETQPNTAIEVPDGYTRRNPRRRSLRAQQR